MENTQFFKPDKKGPKSLLIERTKNLIPGYKLLKKNLEESNKTFQEFKSDRFDNTVSTQALYEKLYNLKNLQRLRKSMALGFSISHKVEDLKVESPQSQITQPTSKAATQRFQKPEGLDYISVLDFYHSLPKTQMMILLELIKNPNLSWVKFSNDRGRQTSSSSVAAANVYNQIWNHYGIKVNLQNFQQVFVSRIHPDDFRKIMEFHNIKLKLQDLNNSFNLFEIDNISKIIKKLYPLEKKLLIELLKNSVVSTSELCIKYNLKANQIHLQFSVLFRKIRQLSGPKIKRSNFHEDFVVQSNQEYRDELIRQLEE